MTILFHYLYSTTINDLFQKTKTKMAESLLNTQEIAQEELKAKVLNVI